MTTPVEYSFVVYGTPVSQGNLSPVPRRIGTDPTTGKALWDWRNPRLVHQNAKQLKPWRQDLANAALEGRGDRPIIERDVAVCLSIVCYLPRPASAPRRVTRFTKQPDYDKLVRALDALTGIVWVDDAQVDECHVWKRFAGGAHDPLGPQGVPRMVIGVKAQEAAVPKDASLFAEDPPAPAAPRVMAKARVRKPKPERPEVGF